MPQKPQDNPPSSSAPQSPAAKTVVAVEFPIEFWETVQAIAEQAGVTPETVISAGTSLYSLAQKAKTQHQKLAIIELDQPCITDFKGL